MFLHIPLIIVISCFIWGLIERHLYTIRSNEYIHVLPKGSQDIVVLHISDIHLAPWQKRKQRWLARLNERIQPDLVINTGDNLGHRNAITPLLSSLGNLKTHGVYVNGSNDIYAPELTNPFSYLFSPSKRHRAEDKKLDVELLNKGFGALGWQDLNNSNVQLKIKGSTINFIGTDDAHEGRDDLSALQTKQLSKADVVIGVTHAPYLRIIEGLAEFGAGIVFAGHTHGGQVRIPFAKSALVTNCDLPRNLARGMNFMKVGNKNILLNVCAGLGTSIYAPFRFACRPEVRVITLTAKD
ncbi:MAG: hypothetical protein RIQ88_770 [Actinomycetota bacterium]